MCLVTDVTLPPKFKVPNFEKYKGISCPKGHLMMYYMKMLSHSRNDKLMIRYLQDNLSVTSLKWYMNLERIQI